jgi:mono/diheme cytochrome c family protein
VTRTSLASALLASTLILTGGSSALAVESATSLGQQIYRQGLLASGQPVQAEREEGMQIEGRAAACVNCHRRSGLGMKEGRTSIPPVAGSYLFHPRAGTVDDLDLPFVEGMRADRDPYTNETLARAIREGIGADGKRLNYLMPHYALDDEQMAGLIAYLQGLSPGAVPGVTSSMLHFATIITPDADPLERQGVLDVLDKFFLDKNHYVRAESPRLRSSRRMMFKVNRPWQLHVWELQGAAGTWEAQLRAHLSAEPVFAVISGVGGSNWAPVHRFCEEQSLPCLFPNVAAPVLAQNDFDNLYLSKGVLLEAQLIAHDLEEQRQKAPLQRVVQVFRTGDVGSEAAQGLSAALAGDDFTIVNRSLPAYQHARTDAAARELAAALRDVRAGDVLVLWLRAGDVAILGPVPAQLSLVYVSGRMAGLERSPLPAAWRDAARLTYPFDLPERRRVRVDYPLGWFSIRKIPVVAQQAQTDTWLACGIVSDAINHMADTFVRDYLVERIEEMLEHRVITGYYPRLALAPGQRFASKGGYIVRFAEPTGHKVVALGDWITP